MKFLPSKKIDHRGFALIFAVVVIAVVATTTLAVTRIVQKNLELTSIGQQSAEAFFAADAGIECALYWDVKNRSADKFPREPDSAGNSTFNCHGVTFNTSHSTAGSRRIYNFATPTTTSPTSAEEFCANVTITIDGLETTVESRGYNTCNRNDSDRVERGLQVSY